jgi:hypothetical protein
VTVALLGGRRKRVDQEPKLADLDALRALSTTGTPPLQRAGLEPTGIGSICIKPVDREADPALSDQLSQLETATTVDGVPKWEVATDEFGYTWFTRRASRYDINGLVNDLYDANHMIDRGGHGTVLVATLVTFKAYDRPTLGMVFRPNRGTWYPFVPIGPTKRDNDRELKVRELIGDQLKIEPDLSKWSPLWDAPLF